MLREKLQELGQAFASEILQLVRGAPLRALGEVMGDAVPPPRRQGPRKETSMASPADRPRRASRPKPKPKPPKSKPKPPKSKPKPPKSKPKPPKSKPKPPKSKPKPPKPARPAEPGPVVEARSETVPPSDVLAMLPRAPECLSIEKIAADLGIGVEEVGPVMWPHMETGTGAVEWIPGPNGGYALARG